MTTLELIKQEGLQAYHKLVADYVYNFKTIESFASEYEITISSAKRIIKAGTKYLH